MSLETGFYFISSVSFATGVPVSRLLGTSLDLENAIVVLPLSSPPTLWRITKLPDDTYTINLNGRIAKIVNGSLKLTDPSSPSPPPGWTILRGAPSPPPIGRNSFGIVVLDQQPQQSWFIGSTEGDQAVEVPVTIGDVASSIVIVPALQE